MKIRKKYIIHILFEVVVPLGIEQLKEVISDGEGI
jgi:hypothetical protein